MACGADFGHAGAGAVSKCDRASSRNGVWVSIIGSESRRVDLKSGNGQCVGSDLCI